GGWSGGWGSTLTVVAPSGVVTFLFTDIEGFDAGVGYASDGERTGKHCIPKRKLGGGVGEDFGRGELELVAEVAQPVTGHAGRKGRACCPGALQPEHRRELAEVVAGPDQRESFFSSVVAFSYDLDLALVDGV